MARAYICALVLAVVCAAPTQAGPLAQAPDLIKAKVQAAVEQATDKAGAALGGATQVVLNKGADAVGKGAAAGAATRAKAALSPAHGAWKGKNVVLFLSDQETPLLNAPPGWEAANLPGMTRLRQHGVEFRRAYTNACMCSSARATLFTGLFPAQHNVRYVLETTMPDSLYPQVNTPADLINMAAAAAAAGYEVVYKGKLHLTKPANPDLTTWTPADAAKYGFNRWNFPDAGANQSLSESGGLPAENDERFMTSEGPAEDGQEGALQYLRRRAASTDPHPFFLVVALVNPHDVLFYPLQFNASGYSPALLTGPIDLPTTYGEDLSTKPAVQAQWVVANLATGAAPANVTQARAYVNFYANLVKQTDAWLVQLLDLMDELGLTDDTVVIRTADHGEMAMSHGGQIQKMFNMYEQSVRVPLVISNPRLYPRPLASTALVSHVDLVPTLATLLGTPPPLAAAAGWSGVSYADAVVDPVAHPTSPQDEIVFTYDDFQYGQVAYPGFPGPTSHLVAIVEDRWKYARYYDPKGVDPPEYEMYDLESDPRETRNLAWPFAVLTPEQEAQRVRLAAKLQRVIEDRLAPRLGVKVGLDVGAEALALLARTGLACSTGGGASGPPVGGAPLDQPGTSAEVTFTPGLGAEGCGGDAAGAHCTADVAWSLLSGAGTIAGSAKAACVSTGGGGFSCEGVAAVTSGTVAFRGLRGEGLLFAGSCPQDGMNGTLSIKGTAVIAKKE